MAGPSDRTKLLSEREALIDEVRRLEAELSTYEVRIDMNEARPEEYRYKQGNEARLRQTRAKLAALDKEIAEAVPPAAQSPAQSPAEPPATEVVPGHPILAVAGRYARMADILELKLADGDNAFSASTRAVLELARNAPVGETDDGAPVVGPSSFVRACIALGARHQDHAGNDVALNIAVARHLIGLSLPARPSSRFAALVSDTPASRAADAVADGDLTRILGEAAKLVARLTPGQARIDIRHALLAALRAPAGQRTFFTLGLSAEVDFLRLFKFVSDHLRSAANSGTARWPADDARGIADIEAELQRSYDPMAAPRPTLSSETRYVRDAPAMTLAEDRLGVADEARALAELICLREPGPPLAIGLFGDWGSGKSTLMNMIEAAVAEVTARIADDLATRPFFVSKAVHIRFNAWHYNDANLWASLTSEFFAQLRAGGHGGEPGARYAALVARVLEQVASLEGDATKQAEAAAKARAATDLIRVEIETLEARRRAEPGRLLAEVVPRMVRGTDDDDALKIVQAMDALGHPVRIEKDKKDDLEAVRKALDTSAKAVETEIERAAALPGRAIAFARALGRAISGRQPGAAAFLYVALLLSIVTAVSLRRFSADSLAGAIATVVTAMGALATAAAGLRTVYRVVEPVFRAAEEFSTRLRQARHAVDGEIASKRAALETEQNALATAGAQEARRKAEIARFQGASNEQVLDYFLNVSTDTRQFEQQLGTVSQVRRVFEQLDAIFTERARLRRIVDATASAAPGALSAVGDAPTQKLQALDAVTGGIDRIVLYIDDLDRCPVEQVVRVLEAVHLLLAFPLFVVVIGVDHRWLQQSLLKVYERQFRDGQSPRDGAVEPLAPGTLSRPGAAGTTPGTSDYRAPVQDYLEKIFQVPIRLRRLGGGDIGRFATYLRSIAGPVQSDRRADGSPLDALPAGDTSPRDHGRISIEPIDVKLRPARETATEMVTRITLNTEELALMTALEPFLGKSPRAVKRFVNIYRLVRGLHRGPALERFLDGADGSAPLYPGVQFWLAADIGLSVEDVARYRAALAACSAASLPIEQLADALATGSPSPADATPVAFSALRQAITADDMPAMRSALAALALAAPGSTGAAAVLGAYGLVERFSLREPERYGITAS